MQGRTGDKRREDGAQLGWLEVENRSWGKKIGWHIVPQNKWTAAVPRDWLSSWERCWDINRSRDGGFSNEKSGNGAWTMTKVKTKNEHDPRVIRQCIFERGDKGMEIEVLEFIISLFYCWFHFFRFSKLSWMVYVGI